MASHQIDALQAPLLVAWQLTRDCDLCCLHCCTESAPGKRLPDELDAPAALGLADQIIANEVPYVMLCGGEPLIVPHFFALAERLGQAGVQLKIETNGQRVDAEVARRLARLPLRSVQVSLDADSQASYARQRPGGSLQRAWEACRALRAAGVPLEITFAPTRFNIAELDAVIERAVQLGAFRFNTGRLMRIGTAARLWERLQPDARQYRTLRAALRAQRARLAGRLELCYEPFSVAQALRSQRREPAATLLVLPNGAVKVAAALPHLCADLRRETLAQAWQAYRRAWHSGAVIA
ncbi:MAG TPA: radical SAM protein, partial [Steroidobacteraceae bacterium]|nr:radical SAM protein [Steroidobacteraceae bacterium]